jgi:hypothetical protein
MNRLDPQLAFQYFGDWTDRIAKGELPFAQSPRPQGVERNIVVTLWDWSRSTAYMHDLTPTDRRNPTVNANGKLCGTTEDSTDYLPILDPARNSASEIKHPVRDTNTPTSKTAPMEPSPYWGAEPIWDNPMMDEKGRVWFTARVRPPANPDCCRNGSNHPSAQAFPLQEANRHLSIYNPATGQFTLISVCAPPALVQRVLLASEAKFKRCVEKQVTSATTHEIEMPCSLSTLQGGTFYATQAAYSKRRHV